MSKQKFIRCKTPNDIIVIKSREDFKAFIDRSYTSDAERNISNCGHPHQVVCGDIWFARQKK